MGDRTVIWTPPDRPNDVMVVDCTVLDDDRVDGCDGDTDDDTTAGTDDGVGDPAVGARVGALP